MAWKKTASTVSLSRAGAFCLFCSSSSTSSSTRPPTAIKLAAVKMSFLSAQVASQDSLRSGRMMGPIKVPAVDPLQCWNPTGWTAGGAALTTSICSVWRKEPMVPLLTRL